MPVPVVLVVLTASSDIECCVFPHNISNPSFSFFPVTCPWVPSSRGHPPSSIPFVFLNVSHPICLFSSPFHSSSPSLFCPCLFLSLYRTPNVSSNGNPGYESLPLTDRQSPPPSVSSSVLVTPSQFYGAFPRALLGLALLAFFPFPPGRVPHIWH